MRQSDATGSWKLSSFPFSLPLSPSHFILLLPFPTSHLWDIEWLMKTWRSSHLYRVKSTYMCPISLGRESLSKVPGWKRIKRLFCCTNDRLYFILGLFVFFLDYLKQLLVIVRVMSNRKVFWLNLVTRTRTFYWTFIMTFSMPLSFWVIYILHLLMTLHIDGGLDYIQAFLGFFFFFKATF